MENYGFSGKQHDMALQRLREALDVQRAYLRAYEKPCEPIAYETLRTLDDLFCRELMEPTRLVDKTEWVQRNLSKWGVNQSLKRVIPKALIENPFRNFPSNAVVQAQADDFIFNCGVLTLSERLEGWLEEGILTGELRLHPTHERLKEVLILNNAASSCFDEEIGMEGLRWASDLIYWKSRSEEAGLEERYSRIATELNRHVDLFEGWYMTYSTTREIDDYFLECAKHYLKRIFSQDMIGLDDVIGGRPFSRYLEVLSAVSARSQKHIAFSSILRARYPSAHIRNLLTTYCPRQLFVESLAGYMDADIGEIESIVRSLILTADNLDVHTRGGETAWVPMVQASKNTLILPIFGLDINPFLFLLTDLRYRYESDWFRVANNREHRWIEEMTVLFKSMGWHTHAQNLRLRENGKEVTDIDFVAYDSNSNQLALFQLKWQHPVGVDNRGRRSAGKNLVGESNRWIDAVYAWLERHGVSELMQRMKFKNSNTPSVRLFVLGRYHVHFSGYDARSDRAIWSDWAHFRKACNEVSKEASIEQLVVCLHAQIKQSRAKKSGDSIAFPVGNIAVVINPTTVPDYKD